MSLPLVLIAALATAAPAPRASAVDRTYATSGRCDGFDRARVETVSGLCIGLVWQHRPGSDGPRMPRKLLQLPGGDWLVTDLGAWTEAHGALWRLATSPGVPPRWTRVLGGLSMPHTVAYGPDGRIYVAEMSRVFALDPARLDVPVTVVGGLPDNRLHDNRHPLSSFVFDGDGALLVNVGAPTDRCLDANGAPIAGPDGGCVQRSQSAQVRRYAYLGGGRWDERWTAYAIGLRNSVALARHASGAVYQAENSVDLDDPKAPYDEINRLTPGGDYGWPYCIDLGAPLPGWGAGVARCEARTAPVSLLPPHAAPIDMLYYSGPLPGLDGRLLISWHGFRRGAGRVVAIETDAEGAPLTDRRARYAIWPKGSLPYPPDAPAPRGTVLTVGWEKSSGVRPHGSPAGMAVASDGAVWIADDRAGAILRLSRDSDASPDR